MTDEIARLDGLKHDWLEEANKPGVYVCDNCGCWTANLPLYKDEVCDSQERRFADRRKRAHQEELKELDK